MATDDKIISIVTSPLYDSNGSSTIPWGYITTVTSVSR